MQIVSPVSASDRPAFEAPEHPQANASRRVEDRFLRRAFRHHSRTFSLATRLLPRRERLPVAVLYLYCRTVDTLADERAGRIGDAAALHELAGMEHALYATLDGHPPDGRHGLLWRRLAEVHAAYDLPAHALRQLIDGARWDLEGRPIRSRADLLAYSDLVAGSVGAAMLPFLVRQRTDLDRLDGPARALGTAMQITNVLRDVGEDCRDLGRCYLPADEMAARDLDVDAMVAAGPPVPEAYAELVESLMAEAERLYDEAARAIMALRPAAQAGIRGAARMYREFLNGVRANGYDNLTRRAAVPLRRKLRVLVDADYAGRREQARRPR